jgi:hypothetical protein
MSAQDWGVRTIQRFVPRIHDRWTAAFALSKACSGYGFQG